MRKCIRQVDIFENKVDAVLLEVSYADGRVGVGLRLHRERTENWRLGKAEWPFRGKA
jgi:hypothetical protein